MIGSKTSLYLAISSMAVDESDETVLPTYHAQSQKLEGLVRLKRISMALGLCIGCFLQQCMLGVDYMLVSSIYTFGTLCDSSCVFLSSLTWSALTTIISLVILSLIRKIINPNIIELKLIYLECRFVVGVFSGVFIGWTITDLVLATPGGFYCVSLVGTLAWFCIALLFRALSPDDDLATDESEYIWSSKEPYVVENQLSNK